MTPAGAKEAAGPETQLLALVACNDFGAAMRLNEETAAKIPFSADVERFFVKTIAEQWPQARAKEPWTAAKLDAQVQRSRYAGVGKALSRPELQPRDEAQPATKVEVAGVGAGEGPKKWRRPGDKAEGAGPGVAPKMRWVWRTAEPEAEVAEEAKAIVAELKETETETEQPEAEGEAKGGLPAVIPVPAVGGFFKEPGLEDRLILHPSIPYVSAQKLVAARAWHRV